MTTISLFIGISPISYHRAHHGNDPATRLTMPLGTSCSSLRTHAMKVPWCWARLCKSRIYPSCQGRRTCTANAVPPPWHRFPCASSLTVCNLGTYALSHSGQGKLELPRYVAQRPWNGQQTATWHGISGFDLCSA